ncbi:Aminodeoxychorismate lyase [Rubellimicrobium mesophilum DSM 19309]|uniref:Probable branched-chain-amino-acid aminotransferase n=1 Tax=Rubellimicrobium mesophilum DSM 19309 TaxID=442562 RepID=A0A017HU04_9RHOB|nr:aminotransferase class IV family protein [Rubellimicrobium mesophilum]EYD77613.1 Aminodeoxychorismate lyase [Rubellimicrobium mesophilum DSM 19309]
MEDALRRAGAEPGLRLVETLAWDGEQPVREERHLRRMARSAEALGWGFDAGAARRALRAGRRQPARLRLTMDAVGDLVATEGPLPGPANLWRLAVHPARLSSGDPWLRHKTTHRALYDLARTELPESVEEWVFLNERGEACEGTITTLFFDRGEGWRTPPLGCGCLPGILREEMLESGAAREEVLRAEDLGRVRLAVGNALRGLVPAALA